MATTDATPFATKNQAYRVTFPIFDADGDLVTGAAGLDSEVSKDGAAFADCTNEATEIGSTGMYYLDLTTTEMNADLVVVQIKTSTTGAKTTPIILYPIESGQRRPVVNTAFQVAIPIFDADGDLVSGASGLDSEVSLDGAAFADCTNEAAEIGSSGIYVVTLTAAEMNADTVTYILKTSTSDAKTTPLVFYPATAKTSPADTERISGMKLDFSGLISDWGANAVVSRKTPSIDSAGRYSGTWQDVASGTVWVQSALGRDFGSRLDPGLVERTSHVMYARKTLTLQAEDRVLPSGDTYHYEVISFDNLPCHQEVYLQKVEKS